MSRRVLYAASGFRGAIHDPADRLLTLFGQCIGLVLAVPDARTAQQGGNGGAGGNGTGNGGNGCGTGLDEVDDSGFFQNRHSHLNYAMKVGVPAVRIEG